mgnify:CR=1 FL=1
MRIEKSGVGSVVLQTLEWSPAGWLGAVGEYVFPANVVTERALHAVDQRDPNKPLFVTKPSSLF